MRILFLHQYYCPQDGWGNDRSRQLMQHWQQAGHEVSCIASTAYFPPHHIPPRPAWVKPDGIPVYAIPLPYRQQMHKAHKALRFMQFGKAALQAALAQPHPDVVIASVTPPTVGLAGWWASRLHKVPLLLEVVDVWPDVPQGMGIIRNPLLLGALHALNARIYAHARHIVALSPGMKQQICAHGVPSHKVTVSYNGTDTTCFYPLPRAEAVPGTPLRVVYAGALGQANALSRIIALMPQVNARSAQPLQLDIYGWGQEAPHIARQVAQLGLHNVYLHPPVPKPQLNAVLNAADIALSSFAPYPVLEANSAKKFYDYLAAGLPVLLNYGGWQADMLATHGCGLYAPQGDDAAWIAALLRLLADAPLRAQMATNARALALAHFDRRVLAVQYPLDLAVQCL